jgi:hypothetical protein
MKHYLSVFLLLCIGGNLSAQVQTLFYPKAHTLGKVEDVQVVSHVLGKKIEEHSDYDIVESNKQFKNAEEVQKAAKKKKTDYYAWIDINVIGETHYISVDIYDTDRKIKEESFVTKSTSTADIDKTLDRLAKKIGGVATSKNRNIYSITDEESKPINRIEGNKGIGFSLITSHSIVNKRKPKNPTGFGLSYYADNRNLIFEVIGTLTWDKELNRQDIGFNIYRPMAETNNTFIYGGGFTYGGETLITLEKNFDNLSGNQVYTARVSEHRYSGLGIRGHFGYLLNRTSSTNLMATISPYITTYNVNKSLSGGISLKVTLNL